MIAPLEIAFADVRASSLRFSLADEPHEPLAAHHLELAGWSIELRVLGFSHQVIAAAPGGVVHETIACLAGGGGRELPDRLDTLLPAGRFSFSARVERLEPGEVRRRGEAILGALGPDPHAIASEFPGVPGALTAIACRVEAGSARWETHHLYPQSGELVTTASRVRRPA